MSQTQPLRKLRVVSGRIESPLRILLAGTEGIGKTTWASKAEKPIFIAVESGTDQQDVARFVFDDDGRTEPRSWPEIVSALRDLAELDHDHKTVVIDTLDAMELLIWEHIVQRDNEKSIESYGYGKGYNIAVNEWRIFLAAIDRLRATRGMHVVMLCHVHVNTFKNPEGEDFDRFELMLHKKAGALMRQRTDDVLFAHYETFAVKGDGERKAKGISTGARVVSTTRTAAWDAKNRHSLPETMPLDFESFMTAVKNRQPSDPAELRAVIEAKLADFGDESVTKKVKVALDAAKDDAVELAKIDNKLTVTINHRRKGK